MNMLTSLKALLLPGLAPLSARTDDAAAGEGGDFAALMQDAAAPLPAALAAAPPVVAMAVSSGSPGDPAPMLAESAASPESAAAEPLAATPPSSAPPASFIPIDADDGPVEQAVVTRPSISSPAKNGTVPDRALPVDFDVAMDETDGANTDDAGADAPAVPDKPVADQFMTAEPSPVALQAAAVQGSVVFDLPAPQIAPPREIAQSAPVSNVGPAGSEIANPVQQVASPSTLPAAASATEAPLHQANMPDTPEKLPPNQPDPSSTARHQTVEPPLQTIALPTVAVSPAAPVPLASPLPNPGGVPDPEAATDNIASPPNAVPEASVKPISTVAAPRRSVTEVLSLLQLARDQLRHGGGAIEAPLAERAADTPSARATPEPFALPSLPSAAQMPQAVAQGTTVTPTVDLTATLGAKFVDMSVSGQWIDGLARDIARFSADGAQGRFQIDAGQLGPVQVDIRQSQDGAAISLTVASEMAEQALRQESDRLRTDAGLSAIRIADVKIERGHIVAEPARADSGQNAASQHASGQQGQGAWPAQGQHQGWGHSSAQSHMHGRGQGRENFGSGAKAQGEAAVLKSEQAGGNAADLSRARYA